MKATITIKVEAESRGELIDTFAASYRAFRSYMEELQEKGVIPREDIRWVIVGGRWAPPAEQPTPVEEGEQPNEQPLTSPQGDGDNGETKEEA